MDRRQSLRFLGSACVAALLPSTAGCAGVRAHLFTPRRRRAALLLPLSGQSADVGRSMAQAAAMAGAVQGRSADLSVIDTGGTAEGAEQAVREAIRSGAHLILGPVFSYEVSAVADALPDEAAMVTFANDPSLSGTGVFRLGVTPAHTVPPILAYARGQGVRRVAIVAEQGPWGAGSVEAARVAAPLLGVEITDVVTIDGPVDGLAERLAGSEGGPPDAVLVTDGGPALIDVATAVDALGLQILGTIQWAARDFSQVEPLHGAWFTAPDPTRWTAFATAYQTQYGAPPGVLTGLAYDAAVMARALSRDGGADREGVIQQARFSGVVGDFGFRADGSSVRDLVVLQIGPSGVRVIAEERAA
jgi:ABC-type branched-subunit amino acid transport system substrate-binding protein